MAYPSSETGFTLAVRQTRPISITAELVCAPGQLLALVGPSGSGKSSLLRMIAGLSHPPSGRIVCAGQTWLDTDANVFLRPQQRRIGYVPQHYGLFPHMSALQNISASLSHLPAKAQHQRAHEWLERMHLDGLARHKPAELSGGQQQRVALARALAADPSILLLDEPFSAVDSATREKLHGELAELRRELAIPVILVTHDLDEAMMLADRMTLLDRGITLQSGTPRDIMAQPADEIAARLLGLRNVFHGRVVAHDQVNAHTQIAFGAIHLASPYRPGFAVGQQVRWVLPDSGIRFRAIARKDVEPRETQVNQCSARVTKLLILGEEVRVALQIDGMSDVLQTRISLRLADELKLNTGEYTSIRLRAEDIHIFPSQEQP